MDFSNLKQITIEHLLNPKVGDAFQEQYDYFVTIAFAGKNQLGEEVVITSDCNGLVIHTKEQFVNKFMPNGYPWVSYTSVITDTNFDASMDFITFCSKYAPTPYVSPEEKNRIAKEERANRLRASVVSIIHKSYLHGSPTIEDAFVDLFEKLNVDADDLTKLVGNL